MKLLAFCVRDEKASVYGHPFFMSTRGLAMRTFSEWVKDPNTPVGKHPEDYRLYAIGLYDDESALMVPEQLELVCSALDFVEAATVPRKVRA